MKHLHILVEGQTEETFVRDVLTPHLLEFDLFLNPVILTNGCSAWKRWALQAARLDHLIDLSSLVVLHSFNDLTLSVY